MILFGISGKARSGKGTVDTYISTNYGFKTYAFADPVKAAACAMFGIDRSFFEGNKNIPHPDWGFTAREILQKIGTDCGRNMFRKDIWIKRAELEMDKVLSNPIKGLVNVPGLQWQDYEPVSTYRGYAITDFRYDNEAEWFRSRGGYIIRLNRTVPNTMETVREHDSEDGISDNLIDLEIYNDGTVDDLKYIIDHLMYHKFNLRRG